MGIVLITALGAGTAAVGADAATGGGDKGALYAAVAAVLVAMIGGTVALLTNRRPEPPSVRYVDAPTSNALPAAMSELYEHVHAQLDAKTDELEQMTIERDLWRRRAINAKWDG